MSLTAKQPAVTTDSTNRAKTDEVLKTPISNASVTKHILNTKANETTGSEQTISQENEKSQQEDSGDNKSDKLLLQNTTQNYGAKQDDCASFLQNESVSAKDAHILQNSVTGDFVEKNPQPNQGKAGFTTHNESTNMIKMVSKDGAATHVNTYWGKVNSVGEDVCSVVNYKHGSFEVPKFHSKDIKVSKEEKSSKQDVMVDHKTQQEVTQKECFRETVGTENITDKNKQTNSPMKSPQNKPETIDDLKATGEMMPKQKDYTEKEITPPKKERPERVPTSLRQETVQTQASDKRKEDSAMLGPSGHLYNEDGNLKVKENKSSITGKKERNDEHLEIQQADRTSTNQQSERTFLKQIEVEEKGIASQQGIKREVTFSKPEVPQRAKKANRPEISAIADYARLKVISAEDDTKEIDFLSKINIYHSEGQTVTELHKNAHGNESLLVGESKREKAPNPKPKPLQFPERDDETLQTQHHFNPSLSTAQTRTTPTASASEIGASGLGGTRERLSTSHKESNTKPVIPEQTNKEVHHNLYQSKNLQDTDIVPLQTEDRSRQGHGKATQKENSERQKSLANLKLKDVPATVKPEENPINMTSPAVEETEELQYYTVNALDSYTKPKQTPQPPSPSRTITSNKDLAYKFQGEEKEESSFLQSLTDYGKVNMTGQQSNSSSPAMGKPTMFKVKDNTIRTSSVTKAVKPRFHRSFSDDFRMGSPREHLSGSEKGDEEHNEQKEPANPPGLHEPAAASHWVHKMRETQNNSPSVEHTAKQSKSHQRRSQNLDDEDTRSVISVMLEDAENCTADAADVRVAYIPKIDSYRDTYQRPASVSYERPESSCYERPESACSDMRPLGKPPTVPPKTEKALRRAQRLTTRRMKKTENKMTPETDQIRNVSSIPSSPSEIQSTHPTTQTTPTLSRYGTEPNFTTPTHSVVAQPFTMTQRKLLQDPNSGQYFMVDMPLPVKTKTFYDPETGKYVQLNVRQRSQSAHSQPTPVEVLNGPYMLYPGFLPMAASSSPSVRSSSQLSGPATLTNDRGTDQWKQQRDPESAYRSSEQVSDPSRNVQNRNSVRHTDIITMSELEDFAMENT
ncbi:cardiac-enriched FHL2-interacting protein [Triplophysa dalaica]|uniref:cardiac-enriched FHL2-interacting protein n=1 Tax=Triplophysa dalaica TaxID=1582913 RepID=UPI0024DF8DEA|nr:cardiac-enriched FHL2-interacting protein [Triplophysa dalaica]